MSTPPRTLSAADAGARGGPPASSECWIQSQVPGRICITPRASALETRSLLNPLSCQAIAAASEAGTPFAAAIEPTCGAVTRSGVGYGGSVGEPSAAVPTGCDAAAEDDVKATAGLPDRWSTVPETSTPFGSNPFAPARDPMLRPARLAIALKVSPGCTT